MRFVIILALTLAGCSEFKMFDGDVTTDASPNAAAVDSADTITVDEAPEPDSGSVPDVVTADTAEDTSAPVDVVDASPDVSPPDAGPMCGLPGQACCSGGTCRSGGSCVADVCVACGGHEGAPCCPYADCGGDGTLLRCFETASGSTPFVSGMIGGVCSCGGRAQPCCGETTCYGGLHCNSGNCGT